MAIASSASTEPTIRPPTTSPIAATGRSRYLLRFSLVGDLRFLSHLDLVRLFERAIRCAELPLRFSVGHNPRPYVQLPLPHPVGVAGLAEPLLLELKEPLPTAAVIAAINAQLPSEPTSRAQIVAADTLVIGEKVRPEWAEYVCELPAEAACPGPTACDALRARLLSGEAIFASRGGRDRQHPARQVNIAPHVMDFSASPADLGAASYGNGGTTSAVVRMRVRASPLGTARPEEVLAVLGVPAEQAARAAVTRTLVELSRVLPAPQSRSAKAAPADLAEPDLAEDSQPSESDFADPLDENPEPLSRTGEDSEPLGQSALAVGTGQC